MNRLMAKVVLASLAVVFTAGIAEAGSGHKGGGGGRSRSSAAKMSKSSGKVSMKGKQGIVGAGQTSGTMSASSGGNRSSGSMNNGSSGSMNNGYAMSSYRSPAPTTYVDADDDETTPNNGLVGKGIVSSNGALVKPSVSQQRSVQSGKQLQGGLTNIAQAR